MTTEKHLPIYINMANTLKEQILSEQYKIGYLLPTEELLQKEFNISRTTVRKAIELLEKEGYVKKFQGRGTEVCARHPQQDLNYLSSISETLAKIYGSVSTGSLTITKTIPPLEVQNKFGIDDNEEVYILSRTKLVRGKTIAYIKNILLAKYTPGLENHKESLINHGLYQTLEKEYKLVLDNAVDNISVYMSGPLDSEIFEAHSPIPLYCSKRKTYLPDGTLFEIVTSFIRAEDFEYTVYLKGRK